MHHIMPLWCFLLCLWLVMVRGQCPWSRELVDLHTDCVCAGQQRLSIQCSPVDFHNLITTLQGSGLPLDLLYISNSSVEVLKGGSFNGLHLQSLHLSRSKTREVEEDAFSGLQDSLASLSLQDNLLQDIPVVSLRSLVALRTLDLSHNLIEQVNEDSFKGLQLSTLKLSDNPLRNLSDLSFRGLEGTLRNLNLQSSGLTRLPRAIRGLKVLVLLDLAQNQIETLDPDFFEGMQSLTALNLERNRIRKVGERDLSGLVLSSLSLLNNRLVAFPKDALEILTELRVLDLGFNGITELPKDAFKRNKYLTLLALDGNPLSTLPEEAFLLLNSTLRGLSLGGSSLECDCRLRWVVEWVRTRDLQVTSRERNPQFCGRPEHLRRHHFLQLLTSDLICTSTTTLPGITQADIIGATRATLPTSASSSVRKYPAVRIKHAYKQDSTLFLEWEARKGNAPRGYQVLIRLFGSQDFKRIIPIPSDSQRLQVDNLPLDRCIVVCIIEFEESNIKVENLPARQCRELKGDDNQILSLDKIVIASSAVVCMVIVVGALIIVSFYLRRRDSTSKCTSAPVRQFHNHPFTEVVPSLRKQQLPVDWDTLSWKSARSTPRTNVHQCLVGSHNFVLSGGQLQVPQKMPSVLASRFPKSYSIQDTESKMSYSYVSKIPSNIGDVQRSPFGHQKKQRRGRLASADSSTECESDWNGRSLWRDNDVDIYISQNHMVSGKHGTEYSVR